MLLTICSSDFVVNFYRLFTPLYPFKTFPWTYSIREDDEVSIKRLLMGIKIKWPYCPSTFSFLFSIFFFYVFISFLYLCLFIPRPPLARTTFLIRPPAVLSQRTSICTSPPYAAAASSPVAEPP
jgi:hypothetical protein